MDQNSSRLTGGEVVPIQNPQKHVRTGFRERLKRACDGRFERGQFDRKSMGHSDRWILRSPSMGDCQWYVG
jgi:hypothetical protein